jgi:hypothetical protein
MMLRTSVSDLDALQKKEEFDYKFRFLNPMKKVKDLNFEKDHLPFGNMLFKIAEKHPKNIHERPKLKLKIKNK